MSQANSRAAMFESAPVHKAFFSLALPSVIGKMVVLLYNLADTWFISRTGDPDVVAGVALISPVFIIMIALGDIFGVGGSSLVSRLMGKNQKQDTRRISALSFYGAMAVGTVMAAILLLFKERILSLLGAEGGTYAHASAYYTYIALGAPAIITFVAPMNLLRTEGMAKASMTGSLVGSVTNIILDPIFIFGLDMGAGGAALATVISNVVSLVIYSRFYHRTEWISNSRKDLSVNMADIRLVAAIGIPAALNNLMNSFATTVTNRFLISHGSDAVAAWSIAGRCTMICFMLLVSFSFSALPLVGYNYGNRNNARLKAILKFLYTFELSLALVCAVVMAVLAPHMVSAFLSDAAIVTLGTKILRCQLAGLVFSGTILISTCVFQATGNAKGTMVSTLSRQCLVYLPILVTASRLWGVSGIMLAQPTADVITAAIVVTLLVKSLKKNKIL